jgi:hypothetical protein
LYNYLSLNPTETNLRESLGIPKDARRVIVFGETSHWDVNWIHTAGEYFQMRIQKVVDHAIAELQAEPRRVFGIESLFFLDLYWRHRPDQRDTVRQLINAGRLRLLSCSLTSPDTNLPATEAILRDYLLGQQWLRTHGITIEPHLTYLCDNFGLSPESPALLRELGIDQAGITRIDGMYFPATDYRLRSAFPLPGSSAELLQRTHRSLDFIWQASDGSEVLTHWNAFTYFQGDMLACKGIIRWMGWTIGIPWRSERHVARRIDGYVAKLEPLSRTGYLFCPIGCDFNDPIPDLLALLDRYNRKRYDQTGTWAVCAGLDDYLRLVGFHRDCLPVLRLDPNPYWMGFYGSRPEAKQRCKRIVSKLLAAESQNCPDIDGCSSELKRSWEMVAVSNHHDFITGTSPDRVWNGEQKPWLRMAESLADQALAEAPGFSEPRGPVLGDCSPRWTLENGRLEVTNPYYQLVLEEQRGGCIVSWRDAQGHELLDGPANDLISFRDSGGLWRMGHEYVGGHFRELRRSSQRKARIEVHADRCSLQVRIISDRRFFPVVRTLWLEQDSPIVRMRLQGAAAAHCTVCVRFKTRLKAQQVCMDVLGGVVERAHQKLYNPTFWPLRSFAHLRDARSDVGLAIVLGGPASLSSDGCGGLDWVALRNAPHERAFGVLPILAHPAGGRDPDEHQFDYAVWSTPKGDWLSNNLPRLAREVRSEFSGWAADLCQPLVTLSRNDVLLTAVKPAHRGIGTVIRLTRLGLPGPVDFQSNNGRIRAAWLVDARERDLARLPVESGRVQVDLDFALTSVRLVF